MSSVENSVPAEGSGNTRPSPKSISRSAYNFVVEINPQCIPFMEEILDYFKKFGPNYMLVGSHVGSSQGLHYHAYVQYPVKKHLTFSKNTTKGAHCEQAFGSAQKCVAYIRCQDEKHIEEGVTYGGDYYEYGTMRLNGGFHSMRAEDVAKLSYEEMKDLKPQEFIVACRVKREMAQLDADQAYINELAELQAKGPQWRPKKEVIYVTGPSDAGKTVGAQWRELNAGTYKPQEMGKVSIDENGFAHTFNVNANTKCLFFEEFRDNMMTLRTFCDFFDKGCSTLNIKGGDIPVASVEKVYLSSIIPVKDLYAKAAVGHESRHQINKRITKYYHVDSDHEWHEVTANSIEHFNNEKLSRDDVFNNFDYKPIEDVIFSY